MAQTTLALPLPSDFPQPSLSAALDREIAWLDELVSRAFAYSERMEFWRVRQPQPVQAELSFCCHESPESTVGACDGGFPCRQRATVHHLESEQEYCLRHFQEVDRG